MNPGTGSREAMEYLVEEVAPFEPVVEIDGKTFVRDRAGDVTVPPADPVGTPVVLHSLSGLRDFIKANVDALDMPKHLLKIVHPSLITLVGARSGRHHQRQAVVDCKSDHPSFTFGSYLPHEEFNIALQTCFYRDVDDQLADVLRVAARMRSATEIVQEDDGVTQAVSVKSGIESMEMAEVPNPVLLTPYRYFTEVRQVTSPFILRARQEGDVAKLALFEGDGGYWRGEARGVVRRHLEELLEDIDEGARPHLVS